VGGAPHDDRSATDRTAAEHYDGRPRRASIDDHLCAPGRHNDHRGSDQRHAADRASARARGHDDAERTSANRGADAGGTAADDHACDRTAAHRAAVDRCPHDGRADHHDRGDHHDPVASRPDDGDATELSVRRGA
jgi:hypothetical protein